MDSNIAIANRIVKHFASRRARAFLIGVAVLTVLAVLQVNNLKRDTPMCELLANSNLCNADIQRMQIALSQSGLREYTLKDNRLMVPTAQHSDYLQAVAEQNAIPSDLRESSEPPLPSVNPFLSRSQQLAIDRSEKKHLVREMVLRLPFVEQAWFEMDKSDSHSAFEQAEQSAVISIRTPKNVSLSDQNVDTVKQMICGAVAGLESEKIVVIDLSAGFARQQHLDPSTAQQVHFQRIAMERQRYYENQIREILKDYTGIRVSVHVDVEPHEDGDHVASIPVQQKSPSATVLPTAGANSFASIVTTTQPARPAMAAAPMEVISHSMNPATTERLEKQISVSIDVPQKLVNDLFGSPSMSSSFATSLTELQSERASQTVASFEQLRSEIIEKVQPVLPASSFHEAAANPISVNLIRAPISESDQWIAQSKEFAIQNWPSAAVLVIGLMLLSIVTRKPEAFEPTNGPRTNESGDVLSLNANGSAEAGSTDQQEARLTKLIDQDPDAAARVIEAWIRDAA